MMQAPSAPGGSVICAAATVRAGAWRLVRCASASCLGMTGLGSPWIASSRSASDDYQHDARTELRNLIKRILLARTPSIATEDAVTVALLHNVVIAYVDAVHRGDPHETDKLFVELSQIARLAPMKEQ